MWTGEVVDNRRSGSSDRRSRARYDGQGFSLPVLVRSGRKVNFWFEVLYFYCNLSDIKRTSELLHQYLERALSKNGADTD